MTAFLPQSFASTREAAIAAAQNFAPHMGDEYAARRNTVSPGHLQVSRLAPAIRVRLLGENEVVQIALAGQKNLGRCQKFVQEVHWRSYWRSWLELRPSVWTRYLENRAATRAKLTAAQRLRIEQIENGDTGIAPMNEFAAELVETGYLHNHARMWFAAFWIHTEGLPWELGADFFERHLICACPASNTLSWRWVAGLQTQGKTYLARRSNLEKYCDAAYLGDSAGLEKLENPRAAPIPKTEALLPPISPDFELGLPTLAGKTGIWVSEDDLSPETSRLRGISPTHIAVSLVGAPDASKSSNGLRQKFRREAVNDAASRAGRVWNSEIEISQAQDSALLAAQLAQWAQKNGLSAVIGLKPFVGPSNDALPDLKSRLESLGIDFHLLRRPEDARLLQHALAGYFRFWSAIEAEMGGR